MCAQGHPHGLHVAAFDADRVSAANGGRQLYSALEMGRHKALVTIHRLYRALAWTGRFALPLAQQHVEVAVHVWHRVVQVRALPLSCRNNRG
jgi:hypothetical protein